MVLHVLYEYAVGYSLYRVKEFEDVGNMMPQVEAALLDGAKFKKCVKMVSFRPFVDAGESLKNINAISEGIMTDELEAFLASNNFSAASSGAGTLGVADAPIATTIKEATNCTVLHTGIVSEVIRGIRNFLPKYIGITWASQKQASLGLGHSYSKSKVKFNVNRIDSNIIQGIAINDQMDKNLNTFAMRLREWYSYHFPELSKIVADHGQYARIVRLVRNRLTIDDRDLVPELVEIVQDDDKAEEIVSAAHMSMGMDINETDLKNIDTFTGKVIKLTEFRRNMTGYLNRTMNNVAPNLGIVIGDQVAARLISHAGSLTNLAKLPASTVQILGAEKALFRALKAKSNTPKYGLIYHSTYIGRASTTDKGRISRFLANKCSIASRIDCFSDTLTSTYGEVLKTQVEDRLKFYENGDIPRKNVEVMEEAKVAHVIAARKMEKTDRKNRKKERASADMDASQDVPVENGHDDTANCTTLNGDASGDVNTSETKEEKKKRKRSRKSMACLDDVKAEADMEVEEVDEPKRKKKKKHRQSS